MSQPASQPANQPTNQPISINLTQRPLRAEAFPAQPWLKRLLQLSKRPNRGREGGEEGEMDIHRTHAKDRKHMKLYKKSSISKKTLSILPLCIQPAAPIQTVHYR